MAANSFAITLKNDHGVECPGMSGGDILAEITARCPNCS